MAASRWLPVPVVQRGPAERPWQEIPANCTSTDYRSRHPLCRRTSRNMTKLNEQAAITLARDYLRATRRVRFRDDPRVRLVTTEEWASLDIAHATEWLVIFKDGIVT